MNFFKLLQKKTERDPSPEIENLLWSKLEREFNRNPKLVPGSISFRLNLFHWIPLSAAALLLFTLGSQVGYLNSEVYDRGMLLSMDEGVEFYEGMEDWMITANDEEWKGILESES